MSASNDKIIGSFERLFDYLNDKLFEKSLTLPVFSMKDATRFAFRYIPQTHGMVIGRKAFREDFELTAVDLIREMIHESNYLNGVVSSSSINNRQYYTRQFASLARQVGFYVVLAPPRGWRTLRLDPVDGDAERLDPEPDDRDFLRATLKRSRAAAAIDFGDHLSGDGKKSRRYQLKYICGCKPPHNAIRSGRRPDGRYPLHITCDLCHKSFRLADQQEDDADPE